MSSGINISNYESFLLRFIDGDLSPAEAAGLQAFLEQHPHLQQELQLLESTVLTPDPGVVFEHKDLLYRGRPEIHADNQTSFLLSYIDQELCAADQEAVEKYVGATPAAQAELGLLQMTRLQPDMDQVFLPKSALYRHRRRVLPVYWWSVGAAAVVAGLLVLGWPSANTRQGNLSQPVATMQPSVVEPGIRPAPALPNMTRSANTLPGTAGAHVPPVSPGGSAATHNDATSRSLAATGSRPAGATPATHNDIAARSLAATGSRAATAPARTNSPATQPAPDHNY
ncbi:MAG TPA: hypothetical protein VGC22_10765, partial [Chitinophaga sp.]